MTTLPRDTDNNAIQALRLAAGKAHKITAGPVSTHNINAFDDDTRVVSIYTTAPVYLNFGDDSVTATDSDHYFPDGVYYDFAIGGDKTLHYKYLSVLAVGAEADVYISEKK